MFDVLDVDVRGGGMCFGRDAAVVVVVDVALVVEDDVEEDDPAALILPSLGGLKMHSERQEDQEFRAATTATNPRLLLAKRILARSRRK